MTAKTVPQVRTASLGKVDLSREREWMRRHHHEYIGQWVVLAHGRLVGNTSESSKIASIVASARAQGHKVPYVRFVEDEAGPMWMGWL